MLLMELQNIMLAITLASPNFLDRPRMKIMCCNWLATSSPNAKAKFKRWRTARLLWEQTFVNCQRSR